MSQLLNIALCTIDDVKAIDDLALKSTNDDLITDLINGFSKFTESYLKYMSLFKATYTEIFDGHVHCVVVDNPPILNDSTFKVYEDYTRVFDSTSELILYDNFTVVWGTGVIRRVDTSGCKRRFYRGAGSIKVVYNGGLVSHIGDTVDVPEDLRRACAMQVATFFQNKKNFSIQATSQQGNYTSFYKPTELLPFVANVLEGYKHHKNQ